MRDERVRDEAVRVQVRIRAVAREEEMTRVSQVRVDRSPAEDESRGMPCYATWAVVQPLLCTRPSWTEPTGLPSQI